MAIIPKASEAGSAFTPPEEGRYRARLIGVTDAGISKFGKQQERFEWELTDEEGNTLDHPFYDYVNVESFFDGGGDPTRMSRLYKIVKAIQGADFDPEASGDTADLIGSVLTIDLDHWTNPTTGATKGIASSYRPVKRAAKPAKAKPKRDSWDDDDDDVTF